MKKFLLMSLAMALTLSFAACSDDDASNVNTPEVPDGGGEGGNTPADTFTAEVTARFSVGDMVLQEPLSLEHGAVVLADASFTLPDGVEVRDAVFQGVKGDKENVTAVGEPYAAEFKVENKKGTASANFMVDSKEMTFVRLTLTSTDNLVCAALFPVKGVKGDWKYAAWVDMNGELVADGIVKNHLNSPEEFPESGQTAGSKTKSFFSMDGLMIDGQLQHFVSRDDLAAVKGKGGSACFLNTYYEDSNRPEGDPKRKLSNMRGYMFSGLSLNSMCGGTTCRQCDVYPSVKKGMYDNEGKEDTNPDNYIFKDYDGTFKMYAIRGSWYPSASAESNAEYDQVAKFFDNVELALNGQSELTQAQQMKLYHYMETVLKEKCAYTLGKKLTTYVRKREWAGNYMQKTPAERSRVGDFIIFTKDSGELADDGVTPVLQFGIMKLEVVEPSDDSMVSEGRFAAEGENDGRGLFGGRLKVKVISQCMPVK